MSKLNLNDKIRYNLESTDTLFEVLYRCRICHTNVITIVSCYNFSKIAYVTMSYMYPYLYHVRDS